MTAHVMRWFFAAKIMHVHGVCVAQVAHSDIPADVLREAHEAYQIVRTDFTENRKLITKANFWKLIYQFWVRHIKPLDPHPERILQWMMSTGKLIPLHTHCCQGEG